VHSGQKDFACPLCSYVTYVTHNLKKHCLTKHKVSVGSFRFYVTELMNMFILHEDSNYGEITDKIKSTRTEQMKGNARFLQKSSSDCVMWTVGCVFVESLTHTFGITEYLFCCISDVKHLMHKLLAYCFSFYFCQFSCSS